MLDYVYKSLRGERNESENTTWIHLDIKENKKVNSCLAEIVLQDMQLRYCHEILLNIIFRKCQVWHAPVLSIPKRGQEKRFRI